MSSRYENIPGGSGIDESLNQPPVLSQIKEDTKDSSYTSRLRPRPTRQTDHFRSPAKRKANSSNTEIISKRLIKSPILKECTGVADNQPIDNPGPSAVKHVCSKKTLSFNCENRKISQNNSQDPDEANLGKVSSNSTATSTKRKLASRSTKANLKKLTTKEKPLTSTSSNLQTEELTVSGSSSQPDRIKTRSTLTRHSKSSRAKITSKVRGEEESKSKSRKRYQSPPNHPLYNRKSTHSGKTGSCASTSRRGRGKSLSANSREQEEVAASAAMSQEAGQPSEEAPANVSGSTSDNQGTSQAAGAAAVDTMNAEADSDDPDMSRLQALLEARGLPSHFFGNLGPRVQQILHRSVNSGTNSKAQQLLQGMQASGDESRQLQSVIEMCQLLVMGNEDTLTGFPIKLVVPALITLLKMEHNFDMMNHACRALTYMMEALPRSSAVVVDAVPAFLEKLQSIQCMDVAEQSLTALEMLSRRHGTSILRANGLSSCLLYLDFFSLPAQRNALTVAANCCSVMSPSDQHADFDKYYESSISLLVQRLSHHDKKCVESVCLCFARLVDNFHNQSSLLQTIANDGLLQNFQNLLVITPPVIGSNTFVMVIRTMCLLCSSCPNLATQLVRNNIAETLRYLLCGTTTENDQIELVPRSPQELYEITSLIGELMPRLPLDDPMFRVDCLLKQNAKNLPNSNLPIWQWRSDDGSWSPYSKQDNKVIEEAHRNGDRETSVLIQGRVYILDFNEMQQVNEDTGNGRGIRRQPDKNQSTKGKACVNKTDSGSSLTDARVSLVKEDKVVISQFVRSLFTLLYEVYGSSAGSPAVRHKCLRAVQRMIYYAEPDLLRDVLKNLAVSSHIASMLSSTDLKVVVGALQMAMILMNKLPDIFEVFFRRQGVTHQVEQLLEPQHKVVGVDVVGSPVVSGSQPSLSNPVLEGAPSSTDPSPSDTMPGRLSDMLRRKYPPRRNSGKRLSSSSPTISTEDSSNARGKTSTSPTGRVISPPLTKAKAFAAAMSSLEGSSDTPTGTKSKFGGSNTRSSATSFFYNFNPTRWGRSSSNAASSTTDTGSPNSLASLASSSSQAARMCRDNLALPNLKKRAGTKENREQVKQWVRDQSKAFLEKYFQSETASGLNDKEGSALAEEKSLLTQLTNIAQSLTACIHIKDGCNNLQLLSKIVTTSDVSSFELQHSGIVTSLLNFLTINLENPVKTEISVKRRSVSSSTPPMTTRRRSKTDVGVTSQSLDTDKMDSRRPKTTSSDERGLTKPGIGRLREDAFQREETEEMTSGRSSVNQGTVLERDERLRNFLSVFVGLPSTPFSHDIISISDLIDAEPLRNLVQKLNLCVSQLEQFAVKSHDLPSSSGRGSQALSFFAKHQLKCQLQRHPDCSKSKQWHGGPVRVDPLALVQAIERYLIARGYGTVSTSEGSEQSDRQDVLMLMADDDSEDEIEVDDEDDEEVESHSALPTGSSLLQTSTIAYHKHRLELYIGSHLLPYNMTVYQAVKHFSENHGRCSSSVMSSDERDTDEEVLSIASTGVWSSTHVIYYKLLYDGESQGTNTTSNKKGSQKVSPKVSKKNDSLFTTGVVSRSTRAIDEYLMNSLSSTFFTNDPSKEVLCLMRVLFGVSTCWHDLYMPSSLKTDSRLIPYSDFVNSKLATKCNRQLQDPLMIMTGELPPWLNELAHACPFVLPFETRHLLFRVVTFDRDRAMQYLLDTGVLPDLQASTSSSVGSSLNRDAGNRFMPKIEKKKCVVKRENLLPQAEKLMQDHGHSRAAIEVQYDGEVGTGLGPTLEFYTLVSHELQRSELCLWRYDGKSKNTREAEPTTLKKITRRLSEIVDDDTVSLPSAVETSFIHSSVGFYPLPVGRTTKLGFISKTCAKFRFLGKFMAKALMDYRMVDIPLSSVCYKWLLGKESAITWFDLEQVDSEFFLTFSKLKDILHQRIIYERDAPMDMHEKISSITMDGCKLEDLGLDFLLPGFPNIELMKGGSKTSLSINNIDKYLGLISHWTLMEGVRQQMDAMCDGFQSVFSLRAMNYFFPEELDQVFCGERYQIWTERELADACRTDHGYSHESEAVRTLLRVLSQYDVTEQRAFLQFVTGSPHLPVGGLRALNPPLTVVRKSSEDGHSPDEYLPSVMTCVNYLKLPDYSCESVMRCRLSTAALEGQKSFLLS